jgi:hypothetical protein
MNQGRSEKEKIEYDPESLFNFGGLLGDYDTIYEGTIFIPVSNNVFQSNIGSNKNMDSNVALNLEAR